MSTQPQHDLSAHGLGEHDAESAGRLRPQYFKQRTTPDLLPDLRNDEDLRRYRDIALAVANAKLALVTKQIWRRELRGFLSDPSTPCFLRRQAD